MESPATDSRTLVLGAGPAGCLLARDLARRGHALRVATHAAAERRLPEETMIPGAAPLMRRIGLLQHLEGEEHRGTARHGIIWGSDDLRWRQQAGHPGWKVDRPTFDTALRGQAEAAGARFAPGLPDPQETDRTILASGKHVPAGLSPRVIRRMPETVALWCLADVSSWQDATIIEAVPEGWWWWLPLRTGATCITLFADAREIASRGKKAVWASARAHARGPAGEIDVPARFGAQATPRLMRSDASPWLVGDAASTIDPLSSQGLEKALASAEEAAWTLHTAMVEPACEASLRAHHQAWEAELFDVHARRTLELYAREKRFSGAPFWELRRNAQADLQGAPVTFERILRAPGVETASVWRRGSDRLLATKGFRSGEGVALDRVAGVSIAGTYELSSDAPPIETFLERAREHPDFVLLSEKTLREGLHLMARRGFLSAAPALT